MQPSSFAGKIARPDKTLNKQFYFHSQPQFYFIFRQCFVYCKRNARVVLFFRNSKFEIRYCFFLRNTEKPRKQIWNIHLIAFSVNRLLN